MPRPKSEMRIRSIRFTDAEWQEIKLGAQALGETRSEAIRAGGLSRVRQAIADVSDVALGSVAAPKTWTLTPEQAALAMFGGVGKAPAREMFVCGWCGAEFADQTEITAHINAAHQDES